MIATICLQAGTSSARSHSFFRARPLAQDLVLENALQAYDIYYKPCVSKKTERMTDETGQEVEVSVEDTYPTWQFRPSLFFFHSTRQAERGRYFLPRNRATIEVAQKNTSDISSPWLRIVTPLDAPYLSLVGVRPRSDVVGASLFFRRDAEPIDFLQWTVHPWISLFMPIVHVRHRLNLFENRLSNAGLPPGFPNAATALDNPTWAFGRLRNGSQTRTGIDDIELKIGQDWVREDDYHFGTYGVIFIPTGTRSRARFMWEPTIGAGPHWGLGFGFRGDSKSELISSSNITFMYEVRYAYLFSGTERRSFDLTNSDWSRYLLVSRIADLNNNIIRALPGINFFTLPARVTPRSTIDLFLALHMKGDSYDFEFGYNLWWRQAERVRPRGFANNTVAIFDLDGLCPPGRTSASHASIRAALPGPGAPASDPVVVPVRTTDFVIASGAHPAALSSKLYVASSWCDTWFGYDGMAGFGLSYEIAHNRAALSQFGIWLTSAMNF